MGWRIKSLSEDGVDTCTHTWAVGFFLFISLLVLVIPLKPSTSKTSPVLPRYEASCWCPAQFEGSHVAYANGVCGEAFNAMIEGREYGYAKIAALQSGPSILPPSIFEQDQNNTRTTDEGDKVDKESKKGQATPVAAILFMMAVCLRIPRILWSILSGCTNGVNIDQTLQAAKAGDSLDDERRQQLYSRLIKVFSNRPNVSTHLYILMKCVVILVILAEIVVVTTHYQITAQDASNNTAVETTSWYDAALKMDPKFNPDENTVRHCFYLIRQMSNVHDYSIQCLFKRQQTVPQMLNEPTPSDRNVQTTDSMFCNLHIIVVAVLVVLAVVNVFNTLCLLCNLCSTSSRIGMGLYRTAPVDLVLLIHMARTNLSGSVASGLAELAAVNSDSEKGEHLI